MESGHDVSLAGKKDCAAGPSATCAGTSKANRQSNVWNQTPTETCPKIKTQRVIESLTAVCATTPFANRFWRTFERSGELHDARIPPVGSRPSHANQPTV